MGFGVYYLRFLTSLLGRMWGSSYDVLAGPHHHETTDQPLGPEVMRYPSPFTKRLFHIKLHIILDLSSRPIISAHLGDIGTLS